VIYFSFCGRFTCGGKFLNCSLMSRKKLVVIAGPTAVGKTSVAIQMAQHFNSAIVSADSRQVFRELTIGTAKPTPAEFASVPHYLVDSHSIQDDFDAARYSEEALEKIADLFLKRDNVFLCGGSGLYIKAVCEGFDDIPEVPEEIRNEIADQYDQHGIGWLQEKMGQLDPGTFQSLDPQNPHRLMRALEVRMFTGESIRTFRKNKKHQHDFDIVKIGLELPREELFTRINGRMDRMLERGLLDEAKALYPFRFHNALQTVGYQEVFGLIENQYDLAECIRLLKRNSRRYAKRQLTWFKKDEAFTWFHPNDLKGMIQHIETNTGHP
jgi:tRNA dimethylallyltransferase